MSEKVTVVAHATAKKGKGKELRKILEGLLHPTRLEKGCINYDLHEAADNPDAFVFCENWTSKVALEAHLETQHIASAMQAASPILQEPVKITLWKQI